VKYGTGYLYVMSFSFCVFVATCGESHTLPKGVSGIPPRPPFFCLFFCPIRINVGTGDVDKIVLRGYVVHKNWSMESRSFLVVKVVPVYATKARRGVEA
jgi:hypothetical protein